MDVKLGGQIAFDDGVGTTYTATITELEKPYLFSFREVDDLINISLEEDNRGCEMKFIHTFDDASWAVNTAAGWHQCLDVFSQIVKGKRQIGKITQRNWVKYTAKLLVKQWDRNLLSTHTVSGGELEWGTINIKTIKLRITKNSRIKIKMLTDHVQTEKNLLRK
ncbi:SRPBCC domain-containing protein [Solibacillus silvestris]